MQQLALDLLVVYNGASQLEGVSLEEINQKNYF